MYRLRRYLKGHYLECFLAPGFKGLEAILQLFVPLVMAQIIDVGIAQNDTAYILWHAALLVGLAVFCYGVSVVAQYFSSKLAAQFGTALRDDLFHHVMTLPREDVDKLGRASLITRITNDTQQAQDGLNLFFRLILRTPSSSWAPSSRPSSWTARRAPAFWCPRWRPRPSSWASCA